MEPFKSVRQGLRRVLQTVRLHRVVWRIAALTTGTVPGASVLEEMREAWGNPGYAAVVEYLEVMCRLAAAADGPILECGSGMSTLLLGLVAGRRGVPVWCLEHDPRWYVRVDRALKTLRIPGVRLVLAPLKDRGTYAWYDDPPGGWTLDFSLVVCDGPPSNTPGGRYGLLPVVRRHLRPGALILLDDTVRPEEQAVIRRWTAEAPLRVEYMARPGGHFAAITLE